MKKKLDFSNVETFQKAPEGTHVAKVYEVEETTFSSGNDGLKVVFEITKGAGKGARVYENFPFADASLWKLKTLLEAIKIKCTGRILLDTDKMIGKTLEIDVYHEEYDGKMRARLGEMRKLSNSKANEDDEDDEGLIEEEEVEEDDEDEEADDEEEEEEEEKPKKKSSASKKAPAKKGKKAPESDETEEDEEEDDEEEKPVKNTKKSPKKKAEKKAPKKKEEPKEDSDDEWEDEEDEWEDD